MRRYLLHLVLFVLTFLATTLSGAEWIFGRYVLFDIEGRFIFENWSDWWFTWEKFFVGMEFSIPFLLFLTCHEFGHYITARLYRVNVSLPFYIPLWLGVISTIGTMGAFIQIKQPLVSRKQFFDIGIAGPLAGFVIAIGVLWYGFTNLPSPEYVFEIHPEYKTEYPIEFEKYGYDYAEYAYKFADNESNREKGIVGLDKSSDSTLSIAVGKNLIFILFEKFVVSDPSRIPHSYEIMHYPYLFAGFLGLLFTALNLMPIGQLDGGHILYALVGSERHKLIAPFLFIIFVFYAGLGVITPFNLAESLSNANGFFDFINRLTPYLFYVFFLFLIFSRTIKGTQNVLLLAMIVLTTQIIFSFFFPRIQGYAGWLAFAFLLGRILGIYHPPAQQDEPLDTKRQILGWITLVIFILCFSPKPLIYE